MPAKPLGVCADLHAFLHGGDAGGQKLVGALDLHQAESACAHVAQAIEMAERWNVDLVFSGNLENSLSSARAHFPLVNDESFDFGVAHAVTSAGTFMVQTPAGQR